MRDLLDALAGEGAGELVSAWLTRARELGLTPDADTATLAAVLAAAYPALRQATLAHPEDVAAIKRGRLRLPRNVASYERLARASIEDMSDLDSVRRGLRRFASRERMRVAARELIVHDVDVDVTAGELSDLADVCIQVALTEARAWATRRFGKPVVAGGAQCGVVVIGMGKLGGHELNAGSDVDLLVLYETDDGEVRGVDGPVEQDLHEHFARITQRMTSTLEDVTEDGFVWRVDLRLRPEGSRGPLVNSLAAAERYYENWGRTWERAALVRARPVAGDRKLGQRVLRALEPFVWRKEVNPRVAHEMASLVARARAEQQIDLERELKLGTGGIREAEFFVQALQLIWGGREPSLRHPNTLEALRRLRARGLVTEREGNEVEAGYVLLRRLEHRVQFATGIQTHLLPVGAALESIAVTLGYADAEALTADLAGVRGRVAERFASLLPTAPAGRVEERPELAAVLAALELHDEQLLSRALGGVEGFEPTPHPDLARHVRSLARRPDDPLGATTRDKSPAFARAVVLALADAADSEQAARLLSAFFARITTPSVYVRVMQDDDKTLFKITRLFGASAFLGDAIVNHPALFDNVVFTSVTPTMASARIAVDEEVSAMMRSADLDPEDALVTALRRAKTRMTMRVGLAELSGEMESHEAARVLSELADASLDQAARFALAERELDGGLAVIAMGKLGGRDIGYGSDLDVCFVYDARDDGDVPERYLRAAQRVVRLLTVPHGEGPGYELDTRLRPSGSQGLLVVSLAAFARYHGVETAEDEARARARDWERQALVRARPCAGDVEVGRRVMEIVEQAVFDRAPPDPAGVHALRMRMEKELARERPGRFDVKLGRGGMVDVEFAAQWLQMKHGRLDPGVRTTDTDTALAALEARGYLDPHMAHVLRDGYLFLRRLERRLRVVHGTSAHLIEEGAPGLASLARGLGFWTGPRGSAVDALFDQYRAITADVRAAYLAVLGVDEGVAGPKNPL
ncbi:MAG: bifunctional [glutamate--ammonia ligase]-adenylyl-L-tyrosine phosphorylase/[glutamate--ammonia-ligase] adenylyltransferase [Myxococcales bacterium]|nr:bifunctional [glutamate--ammonia ligase]-adenylyl-L-tyrosine phosphorylase/[glutamate--ammonia-ligase] adenylyltransferase [Myxococcales bacterium]